MEQKIKKIDNYRKVDIKAEIRADENSGKKLVLRGYPILFNTPTIIRSWWDEWEETVAPTALDETDLRDVYLMVGHNPDNVLGRAGINMRLERDETGLFFECEAPNTQYARDWYNLVESGVVDGMSFGFNCDGDTWQDPTEEEAKNGALRKRTINRITKLWEITITPFPAYGEASVVAKSDNRSTEQGEKTETVTDTEDEAAKKARADLDEKLKKLEEL
jgi:HK97 family phage prohead protease